MKNDKIMTNSDLNLTEEQCYDLIKEAEEVRKLITETLKEVKINEEK